MTNSCEENNFRLRTYESQYLGVRRERDPGNEVVNAHDLIKFATDRNRNAA